MALVFVGRVLVRTKEQPFAPEHGQRRRPGKAEQLQRLIVAGERTLRGCGKLVRVRDTADQNHAGKRGAFTNAGFFKQSGIHAAEGVKSGASFPGGGPRFI